MSRNTSGRKKPVRRHRAQREAGTAYWTSNVKKQKRIVIDEVVSTGPLGASSGSREEGSESRVE